AERRTGRAPPASRLLAPAQRAAAAARLSAALQKHPRVLAVHPHPVHDHPHRLRHPPRRRGLLLRESVVAVTYIIQRVTGRGYALTQSANRTLRIGRGT